MIRTRAIHVLGLCLPILALPTTIASPGDLADAATDCVVASPFTVLPCITSAFCSQVDYCIVCVDFVAYVTGDLYARPDGLTGWRIGFTGIGIDENGFPSNGYWKLRIGYTNGIAC